MFGYVNLGYSRLDEAVTQSGSSFAQGYGGSSAWSIDQASGKVNVSFFGTLNLNGNEIINVSKILGMYGKWKIDENGKLVVKEVQTDKLCIGKICATEKEFETLFWQAGLLNMQNTIGVLPPLAEGISTTTQPDFSAENSGRQAATSTSP